jgi:hypothetical protein
MNTRATAWRIADNFMELPKSRREELAKLIKAELDYAIELTVHMFAQRDPGPKDEA